MTPLSLLSLRFVLEVLAHAVGQEEKYLNKYWKGKEKMLLFSIIIIFLENPENKLKNYSIREFNVG